MQSFYVTKALRLYIIKIPRDYLTHVWQDIITKHHFICLFSFAN
jgi:hypothetical protein